MTRFASLLATAAFGLAALAPGPARAEIEERTPRFAFRNVPEHPREGARKSADPVAQKSGGTIKVRLFGGGQSGGDLQTVSALQGGTLDPTVLNAGLLVGQVREFGLFDLPFLFESGEQADAVVDGPFGQRLATTLPAKNRVGLGYWELGSRDVTNSRRSIANKPSWRRPAATDDRPGRRPARRRAPAMPGHRPAPARSPKRGGG